MLPGVQSDLQVVLELGVSLYAGEAEGRLDEVLLGVANGRLRSICNHMNALPGIEQTPPPYLPVDRLTRNIGRLSSFDAARGCPINVRSARSSTSRGQVAPLDEDEDSRELLNQSAAAGEAVARQHRLYEITHGGAPEAGSVVA